MGLLTINQNSELGREGISFEVSRNIQANEKVLEELLGNLEKLDAWPGL
jgi:hypothetical protein